MHKRTMVAQAGKRSDLLSRFESYCREKTLLQRGDSLIVSVSGGVDSVVLLNILWRLQKKDALRLKVAHFNHQLRGKESDGDEVFVKELAFTYGLPFLSGRANTAMHAKQFKISVQEAARELRYRYLAGLQDPKRPSKVATAHNANDNAETLLLNLCRGAGLRGLSGIPVFRTDLRVIRPLRFATRQEIEAYASENNLAFRTDSSNKKLLYKRNFVRKRILPLLEKSLNPDVLSALNRTSEILGRLEDMVLSEAERAMKALKVKETDSEVSVRIGKLKNLHPFLQDTIVESIVQRLVGIPLDSAKVTRILKLVTATTGKRIEVSKELIVYRDRQNLVFARVSDRTPFELSVKHDQEYEFNGFRFSMRSVSGKAFRPTRDRKVEYIDADRLKNNLILRTWKKGDWFIPLGMKGKKKLSDFFVDQKVPLHRKQLIPVLESEGNIVWVCGVRLDERYRISPRTKHVLRLEFEWKEL